ncbi:co-chaperonin GroES (HSP10) [Mycoplasmoides fastidiosum]|uniref:10 kDa chaperonin n=1 Tax=Mycoplasmoides fastidiosum TaxID=92758 RepID=A0ABU0LY40_9BACT|nr:co-chaperone GroES family protein [Mycoplasmoides fastidiosum]MDQ0513603.1 co-chaperonin GroES (HSP10) [Mycoplasmoides fastidiosum]UUD37974.1 co-chaperone GroES family protein [Mycoplasmoides fastidiosum]
MENLKNKTNLEIHPTDKNILLQILDTEQFFQTKLILHKDQNQQIQMGKIIATGPGLDLTKKGLTKNTVVMIKAFAGVSFQKDDQSWKIINHEDIIAIVHQ